MTNYQPSLKPTLMKLKPTLSDDVKSKTPARPTISIIADTTFSTTVASETLSVSKSILNSVLNTVFKVDNQHTHHFFPTLGPKEVVLRTVGKPSVCSVYMDARGITHYVEWYHANVSLPSSTLSNDESILTEKTILTPKGHVLRSCQICFSPPRIRIRCDYSNYDSIDETDQSALVVKSAQTVTYIQ